jgi:hypothetical protein
MEVVQGFRVDLKLIVDRLRLSADGARELN